MLKQPSTNVKMTNVATIRYKINNKNFQIACYRNKALNYRNGVENDISEVLQTDQIFDNASHGTIAKKADLNKYFQNKTKLEIIQIILERGELQVTDKQRDAQQSSTLAQIINIIVQKCVHPTTKRRFTHEIIKQAIKEIHFAVKTDQPAKKQALQCIKLLQTKYKIARGDMRVKITCKKDAVEKMEKELKKLNIQVVHSEEVKGDSLCRVYDIEPNKYRDLSSMCKEGSDITVEVVVNVVVNQSTKDLENQQSTTLQLLHKSDKKEQEQEEETKKQKKEQKTEKKEQKQLKCSTCQHHAIFSLPADQRAHFKTEWHSENVKRKSKNLPPISAQEHQFNKGYN